MFMGSITLEFYTGHKIETAQMQILVSTNDRGDAYASAVTITIK